MSDLARLLDELAAAHAAATPGPWERDGEYPAEVYNGKSGAAEVLVADCHIAADAALIVAAVNALPQLLTAVRAALAQSAPEATWDHRPLSSTRCVCGQPVHTAPGSAQ